MRKFLLIAASFAFAAAANAADLPAKAPPLPATPGYPYAAGGLYFGLGVSSTAANATIANTNLTAMGAGIDGIVGYQFRGGLDFIATELDVTYTNLGNSGACSAVGGTTSCSTNDAWEIEPLVKFGFPITTVTQFMPNLSTVFPALPALPSGVTATNVHPYIYAGAPFRDVSANFGLSAAHAWQVQPEIGLGLLNQWQQGLVVDIRAGCTVGSAGFDLGVGPLVMPEKSGVACTSRAAFLY